jgi:hypothetical protein
VESGNPEKPTKPEESDVAKAPAGRSHRCLRPGFHWQTPWALSADAVYAPVPWDWRSAEADAFSAQGAAATGAQTGFARAGDPRFAAIAGRFGRDGRRPVEHLDILLELDLLGPPAVREVGPGIGSGIGLPSGELLVSATADGRAALLHGCTLHGGALSVADSGSGRRIAWEPGTMLLVADLPHTSARALPPSSYTTVRRSGADPADALRREAFVLLGTRYHGDIPPAPEDASPVEFSWRDSRSHQPVPTEYPGFADNAEVFLDESRVVLVVRRFGFDGHGTEYGLPATAARLDLVVRMRRAYLHSAAAYASVGAGPAAAGALADTPWTPAVLRRLLPVMSVRTAADAACLTGRSPEQWRAGGWPLDTADGAGTTFQNAEPRHSWRASQAAALAAAGISAERAYELRSAGATSVQDAVHAHAVRPTAAARKAAELIGASEKPVPDSAPRSSRRPWSTARRRCGPGGATIAGAAARKAGGCGPP